MIQLRICFIIMCRSRVLLFRCLLWALILQSCLLCVGTFHSFSFKKYAMTLSTRDPPAQPDLVFLKQYRTESGGWKDSGKCVECIEHNREVLLQFHGCDLSDDFECKVCTRHPPSLADSARHFLFNYTLHLDRFHLEGEVTYDLYVYAARSNQVPQDALLPPEAPAITVWYCTDIDSPLQIS